MSRQREEDPAPEKSPYLSLVNLLTHRYPNLFYLSDFVNKQLSNPGVYPVRVAVLEFRKNKVTCIDFDSKDGQDGYEKLASYLASEAPSECRHRLYLLEDLNPSFIELLGAYLNIDGTVFASQIRDAHFSGGYVNGHAPKLPSFQDPNKSFTLRYYEARYFDDPAMPEFSSSVRTLGNVSRQITFGRGASRKIPGFDGHVGFIRRNTSFWSRRENNGAWNGQ
jgi:hypothetical protein